VTAENTDPKEYERFLAQRKQKEEKQRQRNERKQMWGRPALRLLAILKSRVSHYHWQRERLIRVDREQKSDILGTPFSSTAPRIFIELELERDAPVRNVIKTWMSVDKEGGQVVLIQVFSPHFKKGRRPFLKDEAVFVGEQAQLATNGMLRYHPISLDIWPEDNETVLEVLATKIILLAI